MIIRTIGIAIIAGTASIFTFPPLRTRTGFSNLVTYRNDIVVKPYLCLFCARITSYDFLTTDES